MSDGLNFGILHPGQNSGPILKVISAVGVPELVQLLLVSPNLAVGFGMILRCEPDGDSQFLHEVGSHPRGKLRTPVNQHVL